MSIRCWMENKKREKKNEDFYKDELWTCGGMVESPSTLEKGV